MQTGLTQLELAELLGISRTHLSMAEIGHRRLKPMAMLGVAHLEKYSGTMERFSAESDPDMELVKQKEYLRITKLNYTYRIMLAKKKLQNMEEGFNQANKAILLYTHIK